MSPRRVHRASAPPPHPAWALLALATVGCAGPWLPRRVAEVSAGGPARGWIVGASRLPDRGAGYELFRTPAHGGEPWGVRRLIGAVEHAARRVAERVPGGVPLRVGDLSARRGGRLTPRHHSHRSGRDADLIFFALDAQDQPIPSPAFVRYDAAGVSMDPAFAGQRFDVARNWTLVESLLAERSAGVARIFCADRLHVLLVAWARAHGRDAELIDRADHVLRQPGDSAPHDDHFHVRVACTPDERIEGCDDGAPIWWWLERDFGKPAVTATRDDDALESLVGEPDP